MAGKRSRHVRLFMVAATARLAEAAFLREAGLTVGAVYLAGYAVECALKALVLGLLDEHEQPKMIQQFRGAKAHDYNWLRTVYREHGGAGFPSDVAAALALLEPWGTELRYTPRTHYPGDADEFFDAAGVVMRWAEERI